MPLDVIKVNYGKQYSVFEKLNPFVDKLVNVYKQKKINEWDAEWQLEAMNIIEGAGSQNISKNLLANVNPPEGYIDIEGATNWAKETMNNMSMVQQKEIITGGLTPTSAIPKTTEQTTEQQAELMPDKMEWNEAFRMISELPTGKTDWSSLTELFKKRIESGKTLGAKASSLLNMIMGEAPTDQRAELGKNIDMTNKYMDSLYPETGEDKPSSDYERWLADKESFEEFKAIGKTEEKVFDFETFLKENKDWQIKTVNSKGDVTVGRKTTTTKKWEFDTWGEAEEWTKAHPQEGYEWKIETQGEGFNVTAMKETTAPEPGTKKIVPTYGVIETISEDLLDKDIDYDTALSRANVKYDLSDPNIKLPTKGNRAKKIYDYALIGDEEAYGLKDADVIDEDGFVKDITEYEGLYKEYEEGAKEYYEATGEVLPKEYLSPEEAGKYTGLTTGTGYKGGYKPVLNEANIPWSFAGEKTDRTAEFVKEMLGRGGTLDDYNPEELKKLGVDIEKAKQLISQLGR